MKVGFIGLGNMGSAIARNLIKDGHTLTVYNRTRSRAAPFASMGARIAETASEAAVDAEVLITMLADDAAVEGVIFAPGNAISALPAGTVHISMSTISVALSRRLAEAHTERKQHYVAATVFGRPDVAAAGKLFIVCRWPFRTDRTLPTTFRRDWAEDLHGRRGSSRRQRDQVGGEFRHHDCDRKFGRSLCFWPQVRS